MSQQPQQPSDKDTDPFRPPPVPCEVHCLHCHESYDSWQIEWRDLPDGSPLSGTWCCPTPGCDGIGFGFDILPADPDWTDENGEKPYQMSDDDEEDDDEDDDERVADDDAFHGFGENTFWVHPTKAHPRRHGNTPQPPFDQSHSGDTAGDSFGDDTISDDDIPF